jgi:peptide/nickel transport system substrate-binding protein
MTRQLSALIAIVWLVGAACTSTPRSSSEIPFAARAWPTKEAATCSIDDSGRTRPGLARIESIDETTVLFTLCAPDPAFIQKLAVGSFVVNDSGWLADAIAKDTLITTMNGTGPFKLTAWERGVQIVMDRNETYWGSESQVKQLVFQWQSEASSRLLQLQSGAVDGIDNVGTTDAAVVESDPSLQLIPRSGFNTFYLNFNNTVPPFDDVRVRTAIALGIDSARIAENFYPGGSEVATHVPTCLIKFSCEGPAWHTRDIARAKALLAEAGFPNGFSAGLALRETPRAYLPDPIGVATDIQAQLAEIGVDVSLEVKDPGTYLDQLLSGQLGGMSFSASLPDYPEAWNAIGLDFGPSSGPEHGDRYPALVAAIEDARFADGASKRSAAFAEVNRLLKELVPVIPIAHGASAVAIRSDVRGFVASPVVMEDFSSISPGTRDTFVWLQGGEPAGLYCMDEEDRDTVRTCRQVMEGLFTYEPGGTDPVPRLASGCSISDDGLVYTCSLRSDVRFHNGARFDASDVLDSFAAAWDCAHPLHEGRGSVFQRWNWIMGTLNESLCPTPQ